jgi:hypothetical protein
MIRFDRKKLKNDEIAKKQLQKPSKKIVIKRIRIKFYR